MDTFVSVDVASSAADEVVQASMERALSWFRVIEAACSRFDPASELRQALLHVGSPVPISALLLEPLRFALALARSTGGAFDPTVGRKLELSGFNRNYITGESVLASTEPDSKASFRDVHLDAVRSTLTLRKPLVLDLGAVAKGLAIDLAARELASYENVCVEAGGDLYARGIGPSGTPWRVGIQDPGQPDHILEVLPVENSAVCTSGTYERPSPLGPGHLGHLIDPRTGASPDGLLSVTVLAPGAMAADGFATAAFILGPTRGKRLLEREGLAALFVRPDGTIATIGTVERTAA